MVRCGGTRIVCGATSVTRSISSRAHPLDAVGVDAWGVDYALLDDDGGLLEDPYHYRDARTAGEMERLFAIVSRDRIYATTGIQCLPINTLYQLHAACRETPSIVARARTLLTIPDFFNYRLTGRRAANTPSRRRPSAWMRGRGRGRRRCWTPRDCRRGCSRRSSTRAPSSDRSAPPRRHRGPARRWWPRRVTTRRPR